MRNLFFFFTLISLPFLSAQELQGKAIYKSKSKIEISLEGRNIPAAQKQIIMERMKKMSEKSFELSFSQEESSYKEQEQLKTGAAAGRMRMVFAGMGSSGSAYYKNIQEKIYLNQNELFGKVFLIQDELPQWEWKMHPETKKIGNYTCYKATATRVRDTVLIKRFEQMQADAKPKKEKDSTETKKRPRRQGLLSRIGVDENPEITAWFTPEIPVSHGPYDYWGLPGLILEINDGRSSLLCSEIRLNQDTEYKIKRPSKGKKVTQQEYNTIMADKMEEMSEQFKAGDGRRGRAGNGISIRIQN
ncbi:MAG: GLPGLI family protein [Flavobacteriaceae bacterium]|nr:GLPGLI family protein [Flavobacteriaceae bacterium]